MICSIGGRIPYLETIFKTGATCGFWEQFYRFGDSISITRSDLMSLMPNVCIYLPIVTAWSLEINNGTSMDDELGRFIFNFEHSNCSRKIVEEEEDVETLVNEFYVGWNQWMDESRVTSLLVDMGKLMANFLESKGHPKAEAISSYKFEIVKMKWQTSKRNLDCGVYMMHLMKYFNRVPYTTVDLIKSDVRQLIRAEICAVLLLCNFNEVRSDIIQKVYNFYMNEKPILIEQLKAKKKEYVEKKQEKKRKLAAEMLKNVSEDLGRGKKRL